MFFDRFRKAAYNASLGDILLKFYSAECVNHLYENYFLPEREKNSAPVKMKKSAAVEALVALSDAPVRLKEFCGRMPPELQKALQILVWVESFPLLELEKEIGSEIVRKREEKAPSSRPHYYADQQFDQLKIFELIVVGNMRDSWSYRGPTKERATAQLPPALRQFFKRGFPAPAHSELIGLEEWSGEGEFTRFYDARETLVEDFLALGDAFRRGSIKRNKNGMLSKSCLREFQELVPGKEFFAQNAPEELGTTRLRLLIEFFNRKGSPLLPPEDFSPPSLKMFLRGVAAEISQCGPFVIKELLAHLRSDRSGVNPKISKNQFGNLLSLFVNLPEGQWVSAKNLRDFRIYRGLDFDFFDASWYSASRVDLADDSRPSYYDARTRITSENAPDLLFAPMIHGMAFLLAALGFLEICYHVPEGQSKWRRENQNFLTPFDGLEAVRLTPVGRFAFNRSQELPLAVREQPKCHLHLHPERLLARASNLDPLTEKVLREFMEELAPGFYRLERKRFLAGCSLPKEILARVEDFKRRLPAELPDFWQAYLDALCREGLAFHAEGEYVIFSVSDSPELANLLSTDPELRKCCLRVEGRRVAIRSANLPEVRKRLLKAGFFV